MFASLFKVTATRAMLRDESRYGSDASTFRPERFLKDGRLDPDVQDPATFAFGYGRRYAKFSMRKRYSSINTISPRSCPGSHVALSLLFLVAASMLAVFDISEDIDNEGRPIETNIEWHSGIIRFDLIFQTAF